MEEPSMKESLIKKKLASIKTELKCWESMFFRGHGRKPNENDVAKSGNEIRGAYKEYNKLKKELLKVNNACSFDGIQKVAPENEVKKSKHENEIVSECTSEVFGIKFNKKGSKNCLNGHTHIKDQYLQNRHKLKVQSRRHLKNGIVGSTCSIYDQKNESKISLDYKKENENEVTNKTTSETSRSKESIVDNIDHDFNIITNLRQKIHCPRSVSSGKKGSNKLSFTVSKTWLEKVKPSDEPTDCKILEPFPNVIEEECMNLIRNNEDVSEKTVVKEIRENLVEFQEKDLAVEKNHFQTEKREEGASFLDHNSCKNIENCSLNKKKLHTQAFISDGGNDLFVANMTLQDGVKGSDTCVDGCDNKKVINSEFVCLNQQSSFDTEKEKKPPKKRKHLGGEEDENGIEKPLDQDNISKVSKKIRKVDSLNSMEKVPKGRRLVSENFVAIDIQRKRFHRGKRMIKGSTYKRQQWRKKSLYSRQNNFTCNQYKGASNWVNEYSDIVRGNRRKFSSNVEKKKEDFNPIHQSEEEASCSTFVFDGIPDLSRCWPRIPSLATRSSSPVAPLFSPLDGQPTKDAVKEVNRALKTLGYSSFREGQENAVARIVSGLSTLLVLSTGAGKSLCYQLPAFLYYMKAKYLTIVISPLVALMEDQVRNLPTGIKGACLHTNMTKAQREKVIRDVSNGKIAVLLLSPEAVIFGSSSLGYLPMLRDLPPIAFVCIDEAHCISEWSHNFRPSYLRVCKVLRDNLGVSCFLGLTATCTKSTSISVLKHLGISDSEIGSAIIKGSTMPDNLFITVSKDEDRDQALVNLLTSQKWRKCTSVIIYCTRRDETERLSSLLRTYLKNLSPTKSGTEEAESSVFSVGKNGNRKLKPEKTCIEWDADCYHAGMSPAQRKKVQMRFMAGNLRIVVATTAFGMGLDKANVRAIVHYNMPKSFESFLQEIGRAGRDGLPAYCHIFIDRKAMDLCELRRHTHSNSIDLKTVKAFVNAVFKGCDCRDRMNSKVNRTVCKEDAKTDQVKKPVEVANAESVGSIARHIEVLDEFSDTKAALDGVDQSQFSFKDVLHLNDSTAHSIPQQRENCANSTYSCNTDMNVTKSDCHLSDNCLLQLTEFDGDKTVRCCSGHHVTLSIDDAVLAFDMKEENIATLLSYLEHLTSSSVLFLGTLQASCTVRCYGGPKQMKMLAKGFLPMTAVFNRMKRENLKLVNSNAVTFNVVEIADDMCWDLDPVYHELRSLQWNTSFALNSKDSLIGKSGILVEFNNTSFHVIAPGDLSDDERDHVCSALHETIESQERSRLLQLDALFNIFYHASKDIVSSILLENESKTDETLRKSIEDYFNCDVSEMDSFLKQLAQSKVEVPVPECIWNAISRDVGTLINLHHDVIFSGRALARIFHGIDSPCFPATIWGRDRRFWRRYLDVGFNELSAFITAEIIRFRT